MILDDMKLILAWWKITDQNLKLSQKQPVRYIVIWKTPSVSAVFEKLRDIVKLHILHDFI